MKINSACTSTGKVSLSPCVCAWEREKHTNTWARERFKRDGETEKWSKRNEAFAHKLVLAFPCLWNIICIANSHKCLFATMCSLPTNNFRNNSTISYFFYCFSSVCRLLVQKNGNSIFIAMPNYCRRLEMNFMTNKMSHTKLLNELPEWEYRKRFAWWLEFPLKFQPYHNNLCFWRPNN